MWVTDHFKFYKDWGTFYPSITCFIEKEPLNDT